MAKTITATIPPAIVNALYELQKDPEEIEYGGAIDFEIIKGKVGVERIIAYTGGYASLSKELTDHIFKDPDIEFTFHTHPTQTIACPSFGDIHTLLTTKPSTMMIISGNEVLILTKGDNTPEPSAVYDKNRIKAAFLNLGFGNRGRWTYSDRNKLLKTLTDYLDLKSNIYKSKAPITFIAQLAKSEASKGG